MSFLLKTLALLLFLFVLPLMVVGGVGFGMIVTDPRAEPAAGNARTVYRLQDE
jgi:hypothetical protein